MTGAKGGGAHPEEQEATKPPDPEAGGLDVPVPRAAPEEEAFPGESTLTDDERNRWLILHFALPRTIMTWNIAHERSTEAELNDVLSTMAWGTINPETREWVLESEDPVLNPPHSSLISYAEYVARMYPTDRLMEDEAREENSLMGGQKRSSFTNPGEPGVKFRPMFDQMVKNLAHSNKTLMKAYDLKKVILKEEEVPEDPTKTDAQNLMRYGRHQFLPAFWHMLINLTKRNRRFSIVFRSFSNDAIAQAQRELMYFCQGQHPAYSGQNKTQKPPAMNGDKGSRDMRLTDANIGKVDRMVGHMEFADRPANVEPGAAAAATEDAPAFRPTRYAFPPFHEAYAGLMHHILDSANTAALVDDFAYWNAKDRAADAGKLLLVDHGGGVAETKVQHIFFDGMIGDANCVDVRDVVTGEPLKYSEVEGMFLHRVDLFQAVTDIDYFVKALESCEVKMSQRMLDARRVADMEALNEERRPEAMKGLLPKEYLYKAVIPALLPALEACQRDRPADPIEYIAFYMLRHSRQYSKTLTA